MRKAANRIQNSSIYNEAGPIIFDPALRSVRERNLKSEY